MQRFAGRLLRQRRKDLGLTVEQLTVRTGRAYRTLDKLERDEVRPSVATLCLLADALECEVSTFFAPGDDSEDRATDLGRGSDEWVARTVANAPPLTKTQARQIAAILSSRSA